MEAVALTNMCMPENPDTGEVLIQNRVKSWKGYAFPGGHLEAGESIVDSVIREVREETGLTISHPILCGIKDWCDAAGKERYLVFLFKASSYIGTLNPCSEEGRHFWMQPALLKADQCAEGFPEMLEIFTHADISEDYIVEERPDCWVHHLK